MPAFFVCWPTLSRVYTRCMIRRTHRDTLRIDSSYLSIARQPTIPANERPGYEAPSAEVLAAWEAAQSKKPEDTYPRA